MKKGWAGWIRCSKLGWVGAERTEIIISATGATNLLKVGGEREVLRERDLNDQVELGDEIRDFQSVEGW